MFLQHYTDRLVFFSHPDAFFDAFIAQRTKFTGVDARCERGLKLSQVVGGYSFSGFLDIDGSVWDRVSLFIDNHTLELLCLQGCMKYYTTQRVE